MADYDYRHGAVNTLGIDFETQMIAYIAVASCNRSDLKDFWIASNVAGVGAWDDIILFTETLGGDKNLQFIQLKHKEDSASRISINSADFKRDIVKYAQDFEVISSLLFQAFPIKENQYKIRDILKTTNIPFDKMEFILMSNATYVDVTPINQSHYKLGTVSKKPSNIMTNQKGSVNSIFSNTTLNNSLNLNFTKQTCIVSEQAGVNSNDLLNTITNELKQFISSKTFTYHLEVTKYLVANIKNWFPEKKRIICKDNIEQIISNGILNTLNHTKTVPNVSMKLNTKEWEIFEKLIEPFQLVLVSNADLILQNFFDTDSSHYFINCDERDVDFVINCLKISKDIKIILFLTKKSIESSYENQISVSTLNSLNKMPENLLALLNDYISKFQGREIKFQTVSKSNPSLKNIFTVDDVISLLANQLNMGKRICEIPKYYVSRTIPRIFVNKSIILKTITSHFIIIVNDNSEHATVKSNSFWQTKSREMSSMEQPKNKETRENNYSIVQSDSVSETLINVKSKFTAVHTLKYYKYKEDFVLEWVSSTANIHEIQNFIEKQQFEIEPIGDNLTDMNWNYKNGIIISGSPGMGKTYFSKHLANLYPIDSIFWTVFISLNELNFAAINNLQTCLMDYQNKLNNKDTKIFNSYLGNKSVLILFDGFDEIAPTNVKEALRIIKEGYELGLKIVVTSREATRELLETNLNLLSYTLDPFTANNKLQFIKNYFLDNIRNPDILDVNTFEDKIKQFSSKLLDACLLSSWDEDFTGIPLQCKLLAEGFKNECQHYCQTGEEVIVDNKINLITLYENFIETKFIICIEEKEKIEAKGNVKNKLIKSRKAEFLEKHIIAAVQIIFPQIGIKISEEFMEEIKIADDKFGLITKIDENNNPVFLHRTFAEYFAAKWLVKIKERKTEVDESKREEYLKFLLEPQYNVVHDLFDKLICIDCELHIAVLNGDTTNIREILEKNEGLDEGKCGRTALHLLAARGAKHEREDGRIERKGEEKYAETLKVLLENSVCCDEEDGIFRLSPQQFSNHRNAFGVIDMLLGNHTNQLYNLENAFIEKWDKDEILQMCFNYDYSEIGMKLVVLKELESDRTEELLKSCAESDSVRFAEKVIHSNGLNSEILSKMTFKYEDWYENETLLHIAAAKGNVNILSLLLKYIDVDLKDGEGRTALWFACKEGRLSTVKALLERDAQLFLQHEEGKTPMDEAVSSRNEELLEYVTSYDILKIEFGDDVNAALPSLFKGSTALHFAAKGNNLSTIERLISDGANVNITEFSNFTALHCAFQKGNLSIAKKLVDNGGNLFLANFEGDTPMDFALEHGKKEVLEYVTSYDVLKIGFGENVNAVFGWYDRTALHFAALGNNLSTIETLLSHGANLNMVDNIGQNALHYGCSGGHLSVVKELLKKGLQLFLENNKGETPMDLAIKSDNRELIEYVTSYDLLKIEFGEDVNAELTGKGQGNTALYFATFGDNLFAMEQLISNGANVNSTDKAGNTLLHKIFKKKWINMKTVEFLLKCNLDINAQNHQGQTVLHLTVKEREKKLVKLLLELGANPNILDKEQRTALSVAREETKDETFMFLYERTEGISDRDLLHLHVLTEGGDEEVRRATFVGFSNELSGIVDLLTQSGFFYYGIKDYVKCYKCQHVLHKLKPTDDPWFQHAVYKPDCEFLIREKGLEFVESCQRDWNRWNHRLNSEKPITEEVNRLIESAMELGAMSAVNINAQNTEGQTALHSAAWLGDNEMVKTLFKLGANPNILDNEQRTALSVAREEKKDETFMFLYEKTEVISERDALHKSVLTKGEDEAVRRATFVAFPKELPGIDVLSKAGFYYFGIEDYVRCFQCDLDLIFWEPSHNPWFQHAQFKPDCEFLIREKGIEFIESCQSENESGETETDWNIHKNIM